MMIRTVLASVLCLGLANGAAASEPKFPTKPVRIVVEERAVRGCAESQCSEARRVVHPQEEIPFAQSAGSALLGARAQRFAALE